jgi:hypothetical protein
MTQACIRGLTLLSAFILIPVIGYSQLTSSAGENQFLKHLRSKRLYTERLFLLKKLPEQPEFTLETAWTFEMLHLYDSALHYYRQLRVDTVFHYGFAENYLSLLFKYNYGEKMNQLEHLLGECPSDTTLNHYRTSVDLMKLKYPINKLESMNLPDPIYAAYSKYKNINKKSGLLASGFSIIVPGTGKFYYGQFGAGLNMLIANSVLGLQAFESYKKAGVNSAHFIVFGGLFSIFYLSNIYGTYKGLRKAKEDRRKQLNYEISYHFYSTDLYPGRY